MSMTEEICRWAYAKAMRLEHIRQALEDYGRAVFIDDGLEDTEILPVPHRFVLSRVDISHASGHPLTYCNGVRVA
ncbi:hypothetical protein ABI_21230 [Asticcacaulis biprosthecium C19]|uniref:Uncharacterized protein n=1 Tax=Asticcacaulis biprosthecium C19 TaxID=715226 RepID=F4QGK0_9CAUL|nr:hypothetical protein [Asticcacaulis biprosthecium]EGF93681.1 hypothetical protein ABI_21230 [Asticcacaulis biprosthecium C19]